MINLSFTTVNEEVCSIMAMDTGCTASDHSVIYGETQLSQIVHNSRGQIVQGMDPMHRSEGMEFYVSGRGETLKDAKPMIYASIVNKGGAEIANVDNHSAAAKLKSQLQGSKGASDSEPAGTPEEGGNVGFEALPLANPGDRWLRDVPRTNLTAIR